MPPRHSAFHFWPLRCRKIQLSPRGLLLTCLLALSGCEHLATQGSTDTPYSPAELNLRLPTLKYWQAEGKIAFKAGNQRQKASFKWDQHKHNYSIHIFGPMGVGSTWLRRSANKVTIESSKIGTHRATTPEQLMEALLGWQVPVSNMQHWVKGQLAPNIPIDAPTELNEASLPNIMYQDGWTVAISQYQTVGPWTLPRKITATRGELRLMTVIKNWAPKTSGIWFN